MRLAAIILAAGRARRFAEGDKLLADLHGAPVMRWTTRSVVTAGIGDVVVVTGADDGGRRAAVGDLGVRFAINPDADDGQAGSIALGVASLRADCTGVMIVPADMPALTAELLQRAIDAFVTLRAERIVHFEIAGTLRPPVIWPRALFGELAALRGDGGGKSVVARHRNLTHPLAVAADQAWRFDDIDTRADLAALAARVK